MRPGALSSMMILLLLAGNASARVWLVAPDGSGDAANIQAAIDSCAAGDTVIAAPGTYSGAGNRDIDFGGKPIVVMSSDGAAATIIDCEGTAGLYHRGFFFHSGEDSTSVLRGFTITNGYHDGGAAIYCSSASPKIGGNILTHNFAEIGGGAIFCEGTHAIISGNTISGNEVAPRYALNADSLAGCLSGGRSGTAASFSFGGAGFGCYNDSSLVELNSFIGNRTTLGSAIACYSSVVCIRDNIVSGNGMHYAEGTIFCGSGRYVIQRNTVSDNSVTQHGGGLYCSGGYYTISGNTISGNEGFMQGNGLGGGLYCGPGTYLISDNTITGNWNSGAGGIYFAGSGSIIDNRISGNYCMHAFACRGMLASSGDYSINAGGGITIRDADSLLIARNTISNNYSAWGGAIYCSYSNPEIIDNIIYSNSARRLPCGYDVPGQGGGIYCYSSSPTIAGNTIFGNSARDDEGDQAAGGGIYCISGSSPSISRTIVALNTVDNSVNAGGIFTADAASVPVVSCCDVHDNSPQNYGGYLSDQEGLNGNFALDPSFCDIAADDYHLYAYSPCLPGNHPGGMDCGLIGAFGLGCDFVAALLEGYCTEITAAGIVISWTLSQTDENLRFSVLRAAADDGAYRLIDNPCISREGRKYSFGDNVCDPGATYCYRVNISDDQGTRMLFETAMISTPLIPLALNQNFPNPFNPTTIIEYYLPEDVLVVLEVYDSSGSRIAGLVKGLEKRGRHSVAWNGDDEKGNTVASGVYFCKLTAGKKTVSRKMVLLR